MFLLTASAEREIPDIPKLGNMATNDTGNQTMATKKDGGGMELALRTSNAVPDERTGAIIALGRILDEFRSVNPNMPVAQIQAFLMVALDAGLGMSEISEKTGIKNSTTSRYLIELGASRLDGDGALGLVERGVDPTNTRKARYTLTRKGKRIVKAVLTIMGGE